MRHLIVVFIFFWVGVAPAWAIPTKVEALRARANQLVSEKRYEKALHLLERAFQASKAPRDIANQGIILRMMGDRARALKKFEWYIEQDDVDPSGLTAAEAIIAQLKPDVLILTTPSGATVSIDGVQFKGRTALKTAVVAGSHLLQLQLKGYKTQSVGIVVKEGQMLTIEKTLERAARVAQPVAVTLPGPAGVQPATRDSVSVERPTNYPAWFSVGLGVSAAGAAAVFGLTAMDATDTRDGATERTTWQAEHARAGKMSTLYYTSAGLAGTALLVGAALFLLTGDEEPSAQGSTQGSAQGFGFTF